MCSSDLVLLPINIYASIIVAMLSGMVRETSPLWAAIYSFNPLPLLGLIPVAVRLLFKRGGDVLDADNAWVLKHPFKASKQFHEDRWTDPLLMFTPWAGLILGLGAMSWQLAIALIVAYAQLLVATDSVRLYQWAAPVVCIACVQFVPGALLVFVVLSVVFNPWKGNGV